MTGQADNAQVLLEKILSLPAERIAEVEDFLDFLRERSLGDTERGLTRVAMAATEPTLHALWDNPDDAEYDKL